MNKNTPILIIGFGSIGRRHYANLLKLGYKNVWVYDINQRRIKNYELRITKLSKSNLQNFKIVFVCSPNHLHLKHALAAVKAGCDLFIEKPLSHNLKGVAWLSKLARKNRLINMVACNMRFHPALEFVKKCLQTRKLGKIYSIAHECGHYLPFWRKAEDYRKNYAAKKSTGGGIILDDVHEFDLLFWLNNFSAVKKRFLIFDHISDLRIETEDMSLAGYEFDNKVFGLVKSDYLQKYYSRSVKIVGEKGNLIWDYKENIVWFADEKRKNKLLTIKNYDSNEMYVRELEYFLNSVRTRKKTENDIAHARTVLKNCLP